MQQQCCDPACTQMCIARLERKSFHSYRFRSVSTFAAACLPSSLALGDTGIFRLASREFGSCSLPLPSGYSWSHLQA
jgi:hypothetical protein